MKLTVNGKERTMDVSPDTPLLWVIREMLGLTGTKFGCGMAECGACTVHRDGEAVRTRKEAASIVRVAPVPFGVTVHEAGTGSTRLTSLPIAFTAG
jgi:aerobic-type carbon monoxide dehydrogenase small subunit (CoxS/CutS family)